jgi:hypothetical protein
MRWLLEFAPPQSTPGMTSFALTAKHHLETDERRDVIAYILSRK